MPLINIQNIIFCVDCLVNKMLTNTWYPAQVWQVWLLSGTFVPCR